MIYVSELKTNEGKTRRHNGTPSKKFLLKHPEFTIYYEIGCYNEHNYTTIYDIVNGRLVEKSDFESHVRNAR